MILMLKGQRLRLAMVFSLALLLIGGFLLVRQPNTVTALSPCRLEETTFIIDPGHGGEDGGAVSASGKVESELNLEIGLRLDSLLRFYGVDTMMTRREDISLHDKDAKTLRAKTTSDLHNRVAMIDAVDSATLLSIHQNSFPEQRYHGMQVFYAGGEESMALAQRIQENVPLFLDSANKRTQLKIPSSVYLMNHINCRGVLVECGFLSNPAEDRLLQEDVYQTKVAITIAAACLNEEST